MGSIKLSPEAQKNIREAQERRNSRSLADVVKDIRKERKERQKRAILRMMQGK